MKHKRLKAFLFVLAILSCLLAPLAWRTIGNVRIDALASKLASPEKDVRADAEAKLAALTGRGALDRLAWHLGDDSSDVRSEVVGILARLGAPGAEAVARAGGKPQINMRNYAEPLLAQLSLLSLVEAAAAHRQRLREAMPQAFAKIGRAAVPAIVSMLGTPDAEVRLAAASTLAQMPGREASDACVAALSSEDQSVRAVATERFRREKYTPALQPLLNMLEGASTAKGTPPAVATRAAAAGALAGYTDDTGVVEALLAVVASSGEDAGLRAVAAVSLSGSSDPRSAEAIATALTDPGIGADFEAVRAMFAALPDTSKHKALVAMLAGTGPAQQAGIQLCMAGGDFDTVASTFRSADDAGKTVILQALEYMAGEPDARISGGGMARFYGRGGRPVAPYQTGDAEVDARVRINAAAALKTLRQASLESTGAK